MLCKRLTLRRLWVGLNRWLRLTAGVVLVLYQEIAEALAPETLRVQPKAGGERASLSWSELIATAKTHCPSNEPKTKPAATV